MDLCLAARSTNGGFLASHPGMFQFDGNARHVQGLSYRLSLLEFSGSSAWRGSSTGNVKK